MGGKLLHHAGAVELHLQEQRCLGPRHTGKAPAVWQKTKDYVDQMHELQTLLDKAIAKEDYEKAAELRDKIANLKTEYAAAAKTP